MNFTSMFVGLNMEIDKLQGIRIRKKWYYNNLGEKVDYIDEVYLFDQNNNEK